MTRTFRTWLTTLLAIALFTPISMLWLDKPIAFWVHDVFGSQRSSVELADSLLPIPLLSATVCHMRPFGHHGATVFQVRDGNPIVQHQHSGRGRHQEPAQIRLRPNVT
jgi:hypothetical protein